MFAIAMTLFFGTSIPSVLAAEPSTEAIVVDNYIRAESDRVFKLRYDRGEFGKLALQDFVGVDNQPLEIPNRDLLHYWGVFDLTTPVTITLPEQNERFQEIRIVNEDHYIVEDTTVPGEYRLTEAEVGTRYVQVDVRTFINPDDEADVEAARAIEARVTFTQEDPGSLELPNWNWEELEQLRAATQDLIPFVPDNNGVYGSKEEVDEIRHFIGTAGAWGGGPPEAAIYLNVTPEKNDGETPHILTVKDVPVDGFWSISVYNADGFFERNPYNSYSSSNVSATQKADGSFTFYFAKDKAGLTNDENYLYTPEGWKYVVRLYLPRQEILDGTWHFPKAEPIE